ncbi:hypothetical protein TRP8649_03616 [Pelagimonas phthalicica]|uniref:Uncharacterized protein n=1 Tax=Pelagimonas phthalicica TaxID=1037362 RepID=A0A238JFM0_9RHOB|nr:hypothetical protein [Pelagimonas phthalicica]TDS92419.1 hypothetical protein CLV87_3614 [Pelagimonas phthalicica]SMX29480.1 hypothetical protein TRP8649_03616 [Pelagimonas phthalicica]
MRRRQTGGADESYQLDAVVALFAMILVILVVMAASSSIGPTFFSYKSKEPKTDPIAVSSLAAPFPRLDTWLLRDGVLLQLDYDAAARLLSTTQTAHLAATDPVSGADITLIPDRESLGGFEAFEILLPDTDRIETGGVFSQKLDAQTELQTWAEETAPARVIIFGAAASFLPELMDVAEKLGRPLTVNFVTGNNKMTERRTRQSFSFQGVLRAY